jgi:hypothetical protein
MQACRVTLLGAGVAWAMAMIACTQAPEPPELSVSTVAYAPGLGEIMSLQQMRHVKLWLAGQARNWKLALQRLPCCDELRVQPRAAPRQQSLPRPDLRSSVTLTLRAFFDRLWSYDQVVFDASKAA